MQALVLRLHGHRRQLCRRPGLADRGHRSAAAEYWLELHAVLPFSIVISLMFGLSISTFETMRYKLQAATLELRTRQVEQERAYKLLAEARLSSLESRIHPHFLFNTLNSIAALIPSDPQRAEDTVGKLASLLRFSLNANHSGLVPLGQELKIVRDYLEIEKTRFGPRLRYEIAVPESLEDVKVPPLALQSLVENCGEARGLPAPARRHDSNYRLEQTRAASVLKSSMTAPASRSTPSRRNTGWAISSRAWSFCFGAAGQLEVTREDDKTAVRLIFPA